MQGHQIIVDHRTLGENAGSSLIYYQASNAAHGNKVRINSNARETEMNDSSVRTVVLWILMDKDPKKDFFLVCVGRELSSIFYNVLKAEHGSNGASEAAECCISEFCLWT